MLATNLRLGLGCPRLGRLKGILRNAKTLKFWQSLKRLARHKDFRKLLAVRIMTQASDGTLQVGMASYVLFSPESQPNALAIATVLAITLLPFSIIGPFVSVVLDRWSRQRVLAITDAVRGLIAIALAVLVFPGSRSATTQLAMYLLLLVAMSLNRFLLAGLTAGLPYTVDKFEYLTASSIMPAIGPTGVLIGGVIAGGCRIFLAPEYLSVHHADALIFVIAAVMFGVSVMLAMRFGKHDLGPEPTSYRPTTREVMMGLKDALVHIGSRKPVELGLFTITVQRLCFGLLSVGMILGYRNYLNQTQQVKLAMLDIGLWAGATGVGFVLSAALVPPLGHWLGLRKTVVVLLVASALMQAIPGAIFHRVPLLIAAFGIGLFAQSIKVCVDTITQSHVDDQFKGRVFVVYDMLFNAAMVAAAFLAIVILPPTGFSHLVFIGMGVVYLLLALLFWVRSRSFAATLDEPHETQTQPVGAVSGRVGEFTAEK